MFIRSEIFFPFASYLLAYCLAEGTSPTADRAGGGGGVATLIAGLARAKPPAAMRNFHQGVPRQTFSLFLLKRQRTVSKKKKKKKKKERNNTMHRTKTPGCTLLSFAHPLMSRDNVFAEGKIEYPTDLK